MTGITNDNWLLLIPRIPVEPSRHRVAIWRELRRLGAVPASAGAWALPNLAPYTVAVAAVCAIVEERGGTIAVFRVVSAGRGDTAMLHDAFTTARRDEWTELIAACRAVQEEIDREIATPKPTFAELEEEEQSLARLRRRQRELLRRNPWSTPEANQAAAQLDAAATRLARYSQLVYHANLPDDDAG